jgi:hypothetical protein
VTRRIVISILGAMSLTILDSPREARSSNPVRQANAALEGQPVGGGNGEARAGEPPERGPSRGPRGDGAEQGRGAGPATEPRPDPVASPSPDSKRHALLIGCGRYENPRFSPLEGPANDIRLLEDLLTRSYRFAPQNIVKLVDGDAPSLRPTRANIMREFKALERLGEGHRVLIAYSGHGAQVPVINRNPQQNFEPDGRDEVLLPIDARSLNPGEDDPTFIGAIIDDEIRATIKKITDNKASVCLILDACQSGSATRGETGRLVTMDALGIPKARVEEAEQWGKAHFDAASRGASDEAATARGSFVDLNMPNAASTGGWVAFYATYSIQYEPDMVLPPYSEDFAGERRTYGLLTFTLNRVLSQAAKPLTYKDIVRQVHSQYMTWGRSQGPTPLVEGSDASKLFLDDATPVRSPFRLSRGPTGILTVNAGSSRGIWAGTIFAVYPRPGSAPSQTPLGYMKIADAGTGVLESRVEPVGYPSDTRAVAADALPENGECKIVVHSVPPFRTRVAAEPELPQGTSDQDVGPEVQRMKKILRQLRDSSEGLPIDVVDDARVAEWAVRTSTTASYLVPSSSIGSDGKLLKDSVRYGPIPGGDRSLTWLADWFARFSRAQSMNRVVQSLQVSAPGRELEVEIHRFLKGPDGQTDLTDAGGKPRTEILDLDRAAEIHDGDELAFIVRNKGHVSLDFSLLILDGESGIKAFFPDRDSVEDNTLKPGAEVTITGPTRFVYGTKIKSVDQVVLLAVPSHLGQPVDFSAFDQPSFDRARGGGGTKGGERGARDQRMLSSELGRLLDQVVNRRQRGNLRRAQLGGVAGRVIITWTGQPKPRPTQP